MSSPARAEARNGREQPECGRPQVGAPSWIAVAAAVLVTAPCAAHHSFAMFDPSKSVTLEGVVKELRWTNPHVFIQLLTRVQGGTQEEWSIEMASPEHLARAGWRPSTLKPGDMVRVIIHPMRDTTKGGQYLSGIGPKGPLFGSPVATATPTGDGR